MDDYPAQFGEDRELERRFAGRTGGFFLDVGAADGVTNSNTWRLEQIGWTGVLVEANPSEAEACAAARAGSRVVNCAAVAPGEASEVEFQIAVDVPGLSALSVTLHGLQRLRGWTGRAAIKRIAVPARTADAILEEDPPPRIDLVSIDVEGHEARVLQGLDLRRWQPEVVIVERNGRFPDRQVMGLLHGAGYEYEMTTGVNDWFAPGRVGPAYRLKIWLHLYLLRFGTGVIRRLRRVATGR